ncbi:MAG: polyprenyl synthetase family protein [Chlamydiia bacterium]|nr:polyprenyl synthetase family protein [Chlamydiia bacterium]
MKSLLDKYKQQINKEIKNNIASFGAKTLLRDAIEYSLLSEGKRFRPAILLMIANALDQRPPPLQAALAIEYFHTSSLIADDLPCMDDDDQRRERAALHIKYNEGIALLASYALIAKGYEMVHRAAKSDLICRLALENATKNTGILGATGGQYLDLFLDQPTESEVLEVMEKKTGTLFEISFVFGWLFGGGEIEKLERVKEVAHHFGRAFQIADDFDDLAQDGAKRRLINYPLIAGEEKAHSLLNQEIHCFLAGLNELELNHSELQDLIHFL